MSVESKVLSIQDFLLGYVLSDDGDVAERTEVERHRAESTTVVSRAQVETLTRCTACRDEEWPCSALRSLARPYARHPAYRAEWQVRGPAVAIPAQEGPGRES